MGTGQSTSETKKALSYFACTDILMKQNGQELLYV